ncbi:MAG TPA: twin-arginine translocase TatA/TatE family subunit [Blastocatellia bacterium]|nr:twin-arginine translocase TatA/TatE family subunit [Blastocatellia bacterium]
MGNFGWTEIIFVLVIALIIFGPRKLPELGKSLGASLAQFRRASEDFKRTWEEEVETEKRKLEASITSTEPFSPDADTVPKQEFEPGFPDSSYADEPVATESGSGAEAVSSTVIEGEATGDTKRDWA